MADCLVCVVSMGQGCYSINKNIDSLIYVVSEIIKSLKDNNYIIISYHNYHPDYKDIQISRI